ncbi:hypothetical protein J6590_035905 [Homalodisca vitripennis]|nr:hypothetical protein J6590_035905 [Homalodisca vitripennis]
MEISGRLKAKPVESTTGSSSTGWKHNRFKPDWLKARPVESQTGRLAKISSTVGRDPIEIISSLMRF